MTKLADQFDDPLVELGARLVETAADRNTMVATAESCTGGMIATAITEISGSSAVLDRGFVTYSNEAKSEMLGVAEADIETYGAVSEAVAAAMAEGALARSNADITISVTGIAGPGGGSAEKPVGLVWFGCASLWAPTLVMSHQFEDHGRAAIRGQTTAVALEILIDTIEAKPASADDENAAGEA
ncbi:MAG: CinA family protein [Pseudomonadota bacterium]